MQLTLFIKEITLKTSAGKNEYVGQIGYFTKTRTGKNDKFIPVKTSENFKTRKELNKWIKEIN